ncbi:hypothetical protein K458DRAFT_413669 [Lentithecium fluviatile CBS 122367]|uniref:Uncharacterized protein n=1 Tax=Lentithecium fluviatile CBS 122367 TaxID=1168545 RepID=A0A6G1JG24_9PLEO|nr:hypothetical protein K458DRAFT_413669 [Lentithecium fluviatile CBS 122367]
MAIAHSVWVVWSAKSSEAWDCTNELIALAYKSRPREDVLENCESGIVKMEPLRKVVRVIMRVDEEGKSKAELVFVDKNNGRNMYSERRAVSGEAYI